MDYNGTEIHESNTGRHPDRMHNPAKVVQKISHAGADRKFKEPEGCRYPEVAHKKYSNSHKNRDKKKHSLKGIRHFLLIVIPNEGFDDVGLIFYTIHLLCPVYRGKIFVLKSRRIRADENYFSCVIIRRNLALYELCNGHSIIKCSRAGCI